MKKTLLALAVLSAFAGVASAQSSVTLSGSVDAGVRRQGTATGSDWTFGGSQSGNNAITFSGNEDLGGGMKAFFSVNHRFVIGTGQANGTTNTGGTDPFWRNAWVGAGGGFGDMRLGRMLMPLQDMNGGFDPFATGTVASTHTGGIAATVRANNTIYYRSPSLGGLSVHAAIASGDGQLATVGETGSATTKYFANPKLQTTERPVGLNVRYAAGPINVGLGYDKNSADMKTAGLYASFDFGAAKLMTQFEKGDNYTALIGGKVEKIKAFSVGMTAPLGAFLLRAGYLRINSDLLNVSTTTVQQGDGAKLGIGADYSLSKRTNLYASFGKWSGDRFNAATKKGRYDFGITHRF
jgi:predicted porin